MFNMDIWMNTVCGLILWGALWSAGKLLLNACRGNARSLIKLGSSCVNY